MHFTYFKIIYTLTRNILFQTFYKVAPSIGKMIAHGKRLEIIYKSTIRETLTLSACADHRTNAKTKFR